MLAVIIVIVVVLLLAVFMSAPAAGGRRARPWKGTAFAHRGLHDMQIPENSMDAFGRACDLGCGIELDVQLTRDGRTVVFHDDTLARMTGDTRRVDELDFDQLRALRLPGDRQIPSFAEVLELVNGRVPLLVELKKGRNNARLCALVVEQLRAYRGEYIVESFHPLILLWLRRHAPQIVRGQLVGRAEEYRAQCRPPLPFLLAGLLLNGLSRPDFVAYSVDAAQMFSIRLQRRLFGTPLACWVVKDPADYRAALARGEMPIFEDFVPDKGR